jgi:penicillin G amidase
MGEMTEMFREQARRALPQVEGELRVPGLREPVDVVRDRWGVAHVTAANLHDLWFAQGYVSASDRLFQLDLTLRLANGRLSTLVSQMGLQLDRFTRTVGFHRAAERVAAGYSDDDRAMVEPFAAGVHAWIATMPAKPLEYQVLDAEPYFPEGEDATAYGAAGGVFMSWFLSTNWDAELLRAEIADTLGWELMLALFPDVDPQPSIVYAGKDGGTNGRRSALEILKSAPLTPKGQGSNNWVVAGSRTASGKPLLANDPHLLVQVPAVWYELHLSAPGYEASGVALPFAPGIVIGHTAHHAWGFTNVGGDTQDLYLERLSADRAAALYDGEWEPVTTHREEIEVRGQDEPVPLEVVETRHGPILDSYLVGISSPEVVQGGVTETYALRWVGAAHAVRPTTLLRMGQARSFAEFREAVHTWESPGQNMVYADIDGNIGYQCTGLYPIRRRGDGTLPMPGWSSEYEWDGWLPFEELPWSENPPEGLLATANQQIHDASYPYVIGKDFLPPFRARRIVQMLTATGKHSHETFARMHMDTVSLPARQVLPFLLEVEPADDRQKEALSWLAEWDGDLRADSVAACIYQVWSKHIATEVLLPKLGGELFQHLYGRRQWGANTFQHQVLPTLLELPSATWFGRDGREGRDEVLRTALGNAVEELTGTLGEDMGAWRWGAIHKVRFVHQLALIPDLTELLTAGIVEHGGDDQTVLQGQFEPGAGYDAVVVPSWRQIVDLSDVDGSLGIHTVGQSGNPASPHFNDFVRPWSRGEYHPRPFTREAVERSAEHRLRLVPSEGDTDGPGDGEAAAPRGTDAG